MNGSDFTLSSCNVAAPVTLADGESLIRLNGKWYRSCNESDQTALDAAPQTDLLVS